MLSSLSLSIHDPAQLRGRPTKQHKIVSLASCALFNAELEIWDDLFVGDDVVLYKAWKQMR